MPLYESIASFADVLRRRAGEQPERTAFVLLDGEGETEVAALTYADLDARARAVAAVFQDMDPMPGQALLVYPPGLDFVAAFWGCLYAGVAAVPAYPPRPNQSVLRVRAIAADSGATVGLTTSKLAAGLERRTAEDDVLRRLDWLSTDTVEPSHADGWNPRELRRESLAFLQYTSGSTGSPKGVMVSHDNLIQNSEFLRRCFELSPESVSVTWLPSFHDMGLIDGILQPVYSGFRGVVMSPVSFLQAPFRWLEAITRYGATHCGGPNFCYELCTKRVTDEQIEELDLRSWVTAYNGAEPVHRETIERFAARFAPAGFRSRYFYACYGMAEATLIITGGRVDDAPVYLPVDADALARHEVVEADEQTPRAIQLVGCGRPWLDTEVAVVDPETRVRTPPGRVGEIWVSGRVVALGYWNRPGATEETFRAFIEGSGEGPFLRTGDLGFMRDGELFVTGRIKDVIIIRGQNHYPQDIEQTARECYPGLRPAGAAAFSVEREQEERLVLVQEVERTHLRRFDAGAALRAIREAVADQHGLQVYRAVFTKPGGVPRTSSGKIQRRTARQKFMDDELPAIAPSG